nr:uncharacterized protein LOC100980580 isoform X2 [Pan paniscus]
MPGVGPQEGREHRGRCPRRQRQGPGRCQTGQQPGDSLGLQEALPRTERLGGDQDLNAQGGCSAIVYYVERDLQESSSGRDPLTTQSKK